MEIADKSTLTFDLGHAKYKNYYLVYISLTKQVLFISIWDVPIVMEAV